MYKHFTAELEKIALTNKRRQNMLDATRAALASVAGAGMGYGTFKGLKRFKKPINAKTALLMGLISGGSAIMTNKAIKDYINVSKKRRNSRKNFSNKNLLSSQQQHTERHQGYSPEVSASLLRPTGVGGVQVHSRRGPIYRGDKRNSDGTDNNRRGNDRYRYSGKKTRNYRFKNPV